MKDSLFILFRLKYKSIIFYITGTILITSCSENDSAIKINKASNESVDVKKIKGFKINIEKSTLENSNYRKVLYTSKHSQLVVMSLKPNEAIGSEVHPKIDQFFRFEGGQGKCIINDTEYEIKDGDAILIPAGAKHNIINTDPTKELKLYTIYSPPNHKDGIVRKTKKDADTQKENFDGMTTE